MFLRELEIDGDQTNDSIVSTFYSSAELIDNAEWRPYQMKTLPTF